MVDSVEDGYSLRPPAAGRQPKPDKIRILVVDDEPALRNLLSISLTRVGYEVTVAGDGREALAQFVQRSYDLVLLDVMMPGMDGMEVCRQLRQRSDVPIIMLTGKSQSADIVDGLNLGADAYLTKPFVFKELVAHVGALLRRAGKQPAPEGIPPDKLGDLTVQQEARQALIGDTRIALTKLESDLLAFFVLNAGQPVSKDELLRSVWGYDGTNSDNIVELAVRRLRQKIEHNPSKPERLVTVRGVGYVFAPQLAPANAVRAPSSAAARPGSRPQVQHRTAKQGVKH